MGNKHYKLIWENHLKGTKDILGNFSSLELAEETVRDWWTENKFEPPYIRVWEESNSIVWDYGSHHFFYKFTKNTEPTSDKKIFGLKLER